MLCFRPAKPKSAANASAAAAAAAPAPPLLPCHDFRTTRRAKDFPHKHCHCPGIYLWFHNAAHDKDAGEAYADALLKFYVYLVDSFKAA